MSKCYKKSLDEREQMEIVVLWRISVSEFLDMESPLHSSGFDVITIENSRSTHFHSDQRRR